MSEAFVEHVNVTVQDPNATADLFVALFGWKRRWEGEAIHGGFTVHVGGEHSYIAVYSAGKASASQGNNHYELNGLNHIGVVVKDLDAVEAKVIKAGLKPMSHADYEPGRRFYFDTPEGIEVEVISYSK